MYNHSQFIYQDVSNMLNAEYYLPGCLQNDCIGVRYHLGDSATLAKTKSPVYERYNSEILVADISLWLVKKGFQPIAVA